MYSHRNRTFWSWCVMCAAILAAMTVGGCEATETPAQAEEVEGSPVVLARVGETEVTQDEVEEVVKGQLIKLEQERYKLMEQALDSKVSEALIDLEAAARGVTSEALIAEEVEAKVADPTEAEVDQFYEANKARVQQPKEAIVGQIRDYLKQQKQQQVGFALVSSLREKYGVKVYLEPVRSEVVTEGFASKGPADAPVTIVEFSDFECPYCSRVIPSTDRILENYGEQVRLVFRQFPLPMHSNAQKAAEAALCAGDQGKFWEMHDLMFAAQSKLAVAGLKEMAQQLELDIEAFNGCLDSGSKAAEVAADLQEGRMIGVESTPTMLINGRLITGAQPYEDLAVIVDDELERRGLGEPKTE